MRRILLSLGLVILGSVPSAPAAALQGQGRPLALEDYYSMKSVGAPRISPAGDWIAYTVRSPIEDTNGTKPSPGSCGPTDRPSRCGSS